MNMYPIIRLGIFNSYKNVASSMLLAGPTRGTKGKWLIIKTNLLKLYNCMLNCVQEKVHCSRGALNWKVELAKISSSFPDDLVLLFLHVHHDLNQRGGEKVQEVIR